MSKFLPFYSSLNYKMKKYMKDVKYQYVLDEIQAESNKIIRQQEMNLISKAEAQLRIEELKNILKKNKELKKTSLKSTNAPEIVKEDKVNIYSPPTVAEYENMINKEPKMTLTKANNAYINKELIDELKQRLQQNNKDKLLKEVLPYVNKKYNDKFLDDLITDLLKKTSNKKDIIEESENFVNDLINRVDRNMINKTELENKLKPLFVKRIQENNKAIVLKELISNKIKKEQINKFIDNILNNTINELGSENVIDNIKNINILKESENVLNSIINKIEKENLKINTIDDLYEIETKISPTSIQSSMMSKPDISDLNIDILNTTNTLRGKKIYNDILKTNNIDPNDEKWKLSKYPTMEEIINKIKKFQEEYKNVDYENINEIKNIKKTKKTRKRYKR